MIFWVGRGRPGCCGCVGLLVLLFLLLAVMGGSCGIAVPDVVPTGRMW